MEYYAHSHPSEDRTDWHKLSVHLQDTGARAASFLERLGCADLGRIAGLLHDLGKYTKEFQDRLAGETARVDHATTGAKVGGGALRAEDRQDARVRHRRSPRRLGERREWWRDERLG